MCAWWWVMSPAANCYHTEIMCSDEKQHPWSVDTQHEQSSEPGFTSVLSATEENTRNLTLNDGFNICIQRNPEIAPDVFESPETWRWILGDDEESQKIWFSGRWLSDGHDYSWKQIKHFDQNKLLGFQLKIPFFLAQFSSFSLHRKCIFFSPTVLLGGKNPKTVQHISAPSSSQNPIWYWIIKETSTLGKKQSETVFLWKNTLSSQHTHTHTHTHTHRWTLHLKEFPNVLWSGALMQKVAPVDLVLLPSCCPPSGSVSSVQSRGGRYLLHKLTQSTQFPF